MNLDRDELLLILESLNNLDQQMSSESEEHHQITLLKQKIRDSIQTDRKQQT